MDGTVQHQFDMAVRVAAQFEELKEELRAQANAALSGGHVAGNLGYCARTCEEVERAIFGALNALASYLDDPVARDLLREGHGWQDAKRVSRQVVA